MNSEPWTWSAIEIVRNIRDRTLSATEVLDSHLVRISAVNSTVNAVVTLSQDMARTQAENIDERIAQGEDVGPLAGVPIGIKDTIGTAGIRTTYGSPLFADHMPETDDILVQRIKKADAVIIGKTNTPEFATGGNTYNDVFGLTRNPWNTKLSVGGSTGGGAAGLISGMFPLALGSDLGGSLRIPAAFCGVLGIRPTVGLVPSGPRSIPFDTLGVPGPMARSAEDLALLLEVVTQPHNSDPNSSCRGYVRCGDEPPTNLRIAYVADVAGIGGDKEVARICNQAADKLARIGHTIEKVDFDLSEGRQAFAVLRAQWMVTKYLGIMDRLGELGENLSGNIRKGLNQKPTDIAEAEAIRAKLWGKLVDVFDTYEAILTPTLSILPFPVEQNYPSTIKGKKMENYFDWFAPTLVFSLFGVPALSVPSGLTSENLPTSLQIIGPRFSEEVLIGLAAQVENACPIGFPNIV